MKNERTGVAMKNALIVAGLALLCATNASATEYGIGVSAKSDDSWIYVPIDITPGIRLEPSIRFSSSKSESVSTSTGSFFATTTTFRSKFDQREFALGVFGLAGLTDSARVYYGVRAAYIDSDSKSTITTSYSTLFTDTDEDRQSQDGYRLSPTLGFEYLIGKRFSIGGEAEWFYLDVDGERKSTSNGSSNLPKNTFEQKANGTDTHLIVRYRF
jgi:hypothetical protein